jgi:hypothetical protein
LVLQLIDVFGNFSDEEAMARGIDAVLHLCRSPLKCVSAAAAHQLSDIATLLPPGGTHPNDPIGYSPEKSSLRSLRDTEYCIDCTRLLSPALSHRGRSIAGVAVAMVLLAATAAVAVNIDFEV